MKSPQLRERTMILSSGRCAWAKCMYCGYGKLKEERLGGDALKEQIDNFFNGVEPGVDVLRVYVSGNVTDRAQVPVETQAYMVQKCRGFGIRTLLVETLPQFVSEKTLEPFKGSGLRMVFAMGLECYDDALRAKLQKGFTRADFEKACALIRANGWGVKTYLLVNPPFCADVKKDVDDSVAYALKWADEVTLINCQPHAGTELHAMHERGEWKPLDKAQFFDATKEWLSDARVRYDATQYAPFPSWKSWLPQFKEQTPLVGTGGEFLENEVYDRWQKFICERYVVRDERKTALFIPCSYTKPYINGPLHRAIWRVLDSFDAEVKQSIHLVVISSPGVIPIEFADYYPFNAYDWKPWEETASIKEAYTRVTKKRLVDYLKAHKYERVLCYFTMDAESYDALKQACNELGVELITCLREETWSLIKDEKNALTRPEALEDLKGALTAVRA
ncbi:MAG: DUF5591 domain-containing protein [Candidatus Aenigmatarchaeota archaeon]|nr:MAG: DUF5591 domain-containing protein [Candidatus Aenigmarchaeota archaeon]